MLVGAKIYPSSTEPPIEHGSILIHDGRIAELGSAASIKASRNATVLDCKGLVITAGFWNSHGHILTPGLIHADKLSPDETTAERTIGAVEDATSWSSATTEHLSHHIARVTLSTHS